MKAIVTGHTKGLGAALAQELLERNIPVLALARGTSAELAAKFPELLIQVEIDLADFAALSAWLEGGALQRFFVGCKTALLVNNAGTVQPVGPLGSQDPMQAGRAVMLNVAAPMMLAPAVVRARQGADCRILHISSGAGSGAYAGWSAYCATKAALDHHARAVALDGEAGVRICSLAPGVIDTGMQAEIRATSEELFPMRARFDALKSSGQLSAPRDTAMGVINYLLNGNFGQEPVDDLRQYSAGT